MRKGPGIPNQMLEQLIVLFGMQVASKFKRWPHQKECFEQCRSFLANQTVKAKRDFFVQMATGTGKSLVMADLVAELGPASKACVIVPKLDLMEQMAKLLEDLLPSLSISRVGTGWTASLTADVFVCVRNSAWQLENCSFDLLLLDEAHHYEPVSDSEENGESGGPHLRQVLSLQAAKRIFFSATLVRNSPDFDFSLRPAIEAGIIQDYSIMVPVVSEGDPRPSLVELIQKLPLSRKILAFCSTLSEAKQFTKLLIAAGIPADHYNGDTKQSRRQEILSSFALREADGGIRVLVTVDVLSEGVDLPWADTCLFVSPRRGIRFRQCVGRVLRRESRKLDATVIAPPIVFNPTNSTVTEDQELRRLLQELASVDPVFQRSIGEENMGQTVPLAIKAAGLQENMAEKVVVEQAAELLSLRVLPSILQNLQTSWDFWYQQLQIFCEQNQHVLVPASHKTADGFSLGTWVTKQRAAKAAGKLNAERVALLDELGFTWSVRTQESWDDRFRLLRDYKEEHGDVLVPASHKTADGFSLGAWVSTQRAAKAAGTLNAERVALLDELDFTWSVRTRESWDDRFRLLRDYKEEHGDVLVPWIHKTADGFSLGTWVTKQRAAKAAGKLNAECVALLDELGFTWNVRAHESWDDRFRLLRDYKEEHGDVLVPASHKTADGFSLGAWVSTQRAAKAAGKLNAERVALLDELGFTWSVQAHESWNDRFRLLRDYKEEHGDLLVPKSHKTADGFSLGAWVTKQRADKAAGKLNAERVALLDELGFTWSVQAHESWDDRFRSLRDYKEEHGDLLVPTSHKTADGFSLGAWVSTQRAAKAAGKLNAERVALLDELGFTWSVRTQESWDDRFRLLRDYKEEHGDVLVPASHKTADGFSLGAWVTKQRAAKAAGTLNAERVALLDELGFTWSVQAHESWDDRFRLLRDYKEEHGDLLVPTSHKTADGFSLGAWVSMQRAAKAAGKLNAECVSLLDELGFTWSVRTQESWDDRFRLLRDYQEEHGDVLVPASHKTADGFSLGAWVSTQRAAKAAGTLNAERVALLDELDFTWSVRTRESWDDRFRRF